MHRPGLEGRADHSVQTGGAGKLRVAHDSILQRPVYQQLGAHARLVGRGQHGHGYEQGAGGGGRREPLQRSLHHCGAAGGVYVGDIRAEAGHGGHGPLDGVGYVVELKIEKEAVAAVLYLADYVRPGRIKQLHAYLDKGLPVPEKLQEGQGLLPRGEIAGYDNVLFHP